jgi:hypothetical protein
MTPARFAVVVGGLTLLLAIAGLSFVVRYRPTVEYERVKGEARPVTGWRRTIALVIGSPFVAVVFLLRVLGFFREPR